MRSLPLRLLSFHVRFVLTLQDWGSGGREKLPNIYDTGMIAFKDTMFPLVKDDVTTAILEYVHLAIGIAYYDYDDDSND